MKLFEHLKTLGLERQRALYRVCLFGDGRGEAEFEAPNPWECLVLRWKSPEEIETLMAAENPAILLAERVVVRKKCERCLLHERQVARGDI